MPIFPHVLPLLSTLPKLFKSPHQSKRYNSYTTQFIQSIHLTVILYSQNMQPSPSNPSTFASLLKGNSSIHKQSLFISYLHPNSPHSPALCSGAPLFVCRDLPIPSISYKWNYNSGLL